MATFFHVETHHGTFLGVRTTNGTVANTAADRNREEFVRLLAVLPEHDPDSCVIIAEGRWPAILILGHETIGCPAFPLRLLRAKEGGKVSFYNGTSGRFLIATPPDPDTGWGNAAAAAVAVNWWEMYTLRPVTDIVHADALALGRALDVVLPVSSQRLSAAIRRPQAHTRLAVEIAWKSLSDAQQRLVARALAEEPGLPQAMAALYPDDLWATRALGLLHDWLGRDHDSDPVPAAQHQLAKRQGLFSWLRHRAPEPAAHRPAPPLPRYVDLARRHLGTDLDALAVQGFGGTFVSVPHSINAAARASVEPTRDLCVVTAVRNEGPYLVQWIAYHRAIGVQAFFVYSNDNDDGSDALLGALADAAVITWIRNEVGPGAGPQQKTYGHFYSMLPEALAYRWALTIDADEFFVFEPEVFDSALAFLRWQEVNPVDVIACNWRLYASGGQARWRDEPMPRRFRHTVYYDAHVKSFSRPRQFSHGHSHHPFALENRPFLFRDAIGGMHEHLEGNQSLSITPRTRNAWINHYFFRSAEEYLLKFSRDRGVSAPAKEPVVTAITAGFVSAFMTHHARTDLGEDDMALRCVPGLDAEIVALRALPGVAAAEDSIKRDFRVRLDRITRMFVNAPAVLEAGAAGQAFLHTLGLAEAPESEH